MSFDRYEHERMLQLLGKKRDYACGRCGQQGHKRSSIKCPQHPDHEVMPNCFLCGEKVRGVSVLRTCACCEAVVCKSCYENDAIVCGNERCRRFVHAASSSTECALTVQLGCCEGAFGECCVWDLHDELPVEAMCPCGSGMQCCPQARQQLKLLLPRLKEMDSTYTDAVQPCEECYAQLVARSAASESE